VTALFVRRPTWLKALLALLVVAAIALVAILATRDGGSSPVAAPSFEPLPSSEPPGPVDTPSPPPAVPMTALLTASDAELKTYDGQPVAASTVNVLARVGPSVAWVGQGAATRLLVVLVSTTDPFTFSAGRRLSFSGTVRRAAPGASKDLGLTGADAAELERQGVYVEIETYLVA
jgi:hypothetical protein